MLPPGCSLLRVPKELYGYQSHDEHGKLVASYRPTLTPSGRKSGQYFISPDLPVQVVDPNTVEGRLPLMLPPAGTEIAWERSGYTIYG